MKSIFALLFIFSLVSQVCYGQQAPTAPSPANISTVPPRRYSAEEMTRFRAMQAAPSTVATPGMPLLNGNQPTDASRVSKTGNPVQATSFQTSASGPGLMKADDDIGPAKPGTDVIPVPAILSGKATSATRPETMSQRMPDEISMTQPQLPPATSNGAFPMGGQQPSADPALKTSERPKAEAATMSPTMPQPGQPPIDLRRETASTQFAGRTQGMPGRVTPVSGNQEPTESLNGSSIPATDAPLKTRSATEALPNATESSSRQASPSASSAPFDSGRIARSNSTNTALANPGLSSGRTLIHAPEDQTTINSPGAAIGVSTTGPKSISIGKNAAYGVVVANSGQTAAQQLVVTFTVPSWIELANTNLTAGSKELIRETDATRVVWRIERLDPGTSQRLTLDVIPRKAQVFDLNVEWSVAPLIGAVQVQVTEPLLKMAITGPEEVQFGQSAMYTIVIQNPGTGVAENVNVMLSEALGGERAPLGNLGPGEEKNIQVELIARSAGSLDLSAGVSGDGNLQDNVLKKITVRRAQLDVAIQGPAMKYAGSTGNYQITVENTGDAIAQDVFAALGFPVGAQYLAGIEGGEKIEGGLRWSVGALPPGAKRTYTIACQLNAAGPLRIETGARGAGDLADADSIQTMVETDADLVLSVDDPQGPLPVGQGATYKISVKNRGTKSANDIQVVMHFSAGIEPTTAEGRGHKINPGEVAFEPIGQLDPGEDAVFTITARATIPGTHEFRAQMTCEAADAREVAGGTTKFFGDDVFETNAADPSIQMGSKPLINSMRK